MKRLFVLSLKGGVDLSLDVATGCIEDVETGEEYIFHAVSELIQRLRYIAGPVDVKDQGCPANSAEPDREPRTTDA
jgi:hypothetical protein